MKVIVDTCVWSLALRRNEPSASAEVRLLQELVQDGRVAMLGPIRQELLSGVKTPAQFKNLAGALFPILTTDGDFGHFKKVLRVKLAAATS